MSWRRGYIIKDRIKQIRKVFHLSQTEFAERLGASRGVIANIELDRVEPRDPFINLICREFGVNEIWLRTGDGEMFAPKSQSDMLAEAAGKLLGSNPDAAWTKIVMALINLSDEDREAAVRIALELANQLRAETEKKGEE